MVGGLEGAFIAITITRLDFSLGILGDHTPSRGLLINKIIPLPFLIGGLAVASAGGGVGGGALLVVVHMVVESIEEFGYPCALQLHAAGGA